MQACRWSQPRMDAAQQCGTCPTVRIPMEIDHSRREGKYRFETRHFRGRTWQAINDTQVKPVKQHHEGGEAGPMGPGRELDPGAVAGKSKTTSRGSGVGFAIRSLGVTGFAHQGLPREDKQDRGEGTPALDYCWRIRTPLPSCFEVRILERPGQDLATGQGTGTGAVGGARLALPRLAAGALERG